MSDIVYCYLCTHDWFRDDWGLICPYCENEATEIVEVDGDPLPTEDGFSEQDIVSILQNGADQERAKSLIYGRHTFRETGSRESEAARTGEPKGENLPSEGQEEEVVVAVMGVTGSGKSTFIRTMTEKDHVHVGHGLESDTSEISCHRFTYGRINFVLVDTPGFNDTNRRDEEIMTQVLEWLESSFRSGMRLNGIIYLHRIIDPKLQGSARSNMSMFRKLCGPKCFGNIILAMTFWDHVPAELGAKREQQLKEKSEFWGEMVKKGSDVVRLGLGRECGIRLLMRIAGKQKVVLECQREMVEENKTVHETVAARSVFEEIERQREEFEKRITEEKAESKRELERQAQLREQALEQERIQAAERERRRAERAATQKAKEEAAWKAEYARKQEELRKAAEDAKREQRRKEDAERRKQQAAEAQRWELQTLREERERYYNDYACQRVSVHSLTCDKCIAIIKGAWYYHCCFCRGDNYDQCESCGSRCPISAHPRMKYRYMPPPPVHDDCVVM